MRKTASQIADEVLEKCALSAGKILRAVRKSGKPEVAAPRATKVLDYVERLAKGKPEGVVKGLYKYPNMSRRALKAHMKGK